jgi:hypothetical protein
MLRKIGLVLVIIFAAGNIASAAQFDASAMFRYEEKAKYYDLKENQILSIGNSISSKAFQLDDRAARAVFIAEPDQLSLNNFPTTPSEKSNLVLRKFRGVITENTVFSAANEDGVYERKAPEITTYIGTIAGQPESQVIINYYKDHMVAMIEHEDGRRTVISPMKALAEAEVGQHLIKDEASFYPEDVRLFECTTEDFVNTEIDESKHGHETLSNSMLIAQVPIEASSNMHSLMGSDYDKTVAYMIAIMNRISMIFERDLNIFVEVPYIHVWESPDTDPYAKVNVDVGSRLYRMPNVWNGQHSGQANDRAIACLFTALYNDGSYQAAGVTLGTNGLCRTSQGYCVFGIENGYNFPSMGYHSDVSTAVHELGHGFGSPHTHGCEFKPPIDTCITRYEPVNPSDGCVTTGSPIPRPGTIMSYCHLTNSSRTVELYFHDRVKTVIWNKVASRQCVVSPKIPKISYAGPFEGLFQANKPIEISWYSALINNIRIDYSSDAGATWHLAAENVDPDPGVYSWIAPDIYSDSVMIRIYDQSNINIISEYPIYLGIHPAKLEFTNPNSDNGFEKQTEATIAWDKEFVEAVDIYFTSDGGSNWSLIKENVTAVVYDIEIPDVYSENCKFRLVSRPDGEIVSESVEFSVGDPSATAVSPVNGDVFENNIAIPLVFEYKNLTEFFIYYSLDNGENWKKISPVAYTTDKLPVEWSTNKTSTQAKVRLVSNTNKDVVLAETDGTFEIREEVTSVEDDVIAQDMISIEKVSPNPVSNDTKIVLNINDQNARQVELKLFHSVGYEVKLPVDTYNVVSGYNEIELNLEELPIGAYFLTVSSGNNSASYPVQVIR